MSLAKLTAGASHAALMERAAALASEVQRLDEALVELEARAVMLTAERDAAHERVDALRLAIVEGEATLDSDVRTLDTLRGEVQSADGAVFSLRMQADTQETAIKSARAAVDTLRAAVAELDIQRVTAESDLAHLAQASVDSVQATLDDVLAEVATLEAAGDLTPDARIICADEAPTADETDWPQILALYEVLERVSPGPVVTLNRAVAVARVHGPRAGLALLGTLDDDERMAQTHRLEAVRAHLLEMAGDTAAAREAYQLAARKTASLPEQRYLALRAARLS